jgi:hypothetical protein
MQWVFTLKIVFWKFGNPSGLQLPKWELTWECGGSFPHTLLHFWEHECYSWASFLARTFTSPCLGREPKVRVVTLELKFKDIYHNRLIERKIWSSAQWSLRKMWLEYQHKVLTKRSSSKRIWSLKGTLGSHQGCLTYSKHVPFMHVPFHNNTQF